jgi:hypothetical protein
MPCHARKCFCRLPCRIAGTHAGLRVAPHSTLLAHEHNQASREDQIRGKARDVGRISEDQGEARRGNDSIQQDRAEHGRQ